MKDLPALLLILFMFVAISLSVRNNTDREPIHQSSGRLVGREVTATLPDEEEEYIGDVLFRKGFGFYPSIEKTND